MISRPIRLLFLICFFIVNTAWNGQEITISPAAQFLGIAHGAHLRPTYEYGQEILDFNALTGKDIAVLMYFSDWESVDVESGSFFDFFLLKKIQERMGDQGPVIMISWQPLNGRKKLAGKPACDRDYSGAIPLDDIINGHCDDYIRGFAQALKSRPERFLLRFAHEMNITDSPWWPGHYGQDASKYVQMWRHVHDLVESQNVTNVEWVWSPNYASNPGSSWNDLHNYYPGDIYVDWIGLSGYNWYSTRGVPWKTFQNLYHQVLVDLTCRYAKPQIIAEVGTVEGEPTKSGWIIEMYNQVPDYPFLRLVSYFNDFAYGSSASADFRVTTGTEESGHVAPLPQGSGVWTEAYSQAISRGIYRSDLPALAAVTPPHVYCGEATPVFLLTPDSSLIEPGETSLHSLIGLLYSEVQTVRLDLSQTPYFKDSFVSPAQLDTPWDIASITLIASASTPLGVYSIPVLVNSRELTIQVRVVSFVGKQYLPVIQ